jgi:nucleoside-diphosphate-sugar epimerase
VSRSVVAVTGATGFIGRAFCRRALRDGRALRRFAHRSAHASDGCIALDLADARVDELARSLDGVEIVVHLAGRAHVMHEATRDFESAYRDANERGTRVLAQAALAAGVRRFIFASTVKVNGEATMPNRPLRPDAAPAPQDAYARSKLAGEAALAQVAGGTPMHAIVLRLPLVYGPGARGNFRRLVDAVRAGRWLPLGAIDNRRSLIGIDNLLDAFDAAIDAPDVLNGIHFVADADSVSTPDLVRAIARALETAPRLVPVPVSMLRLAGLLTARRDAIARLTSSLEVDSTSFAAATGWRARAFAIDAATFRA